MGHERHEGLAREIAAGEEGRDRRDDRVEPVGRADEDHVVRSEAGHFRLQLRHHVVIQLLPAPGQHVAVGRRIRVGRHDLEDVRAGRFLDLPGDGAGVAGVREIRDQHLLAPFRRRLGRGARLRNERSQHGQHQGFDLHVHRDAPKSGLLGLALGLRLVLRLLPLPQHRRDLPFALALQFLEPGHCRFPADLHLALDLLPVDDGGHADARQIGEPSLREPQALAQGFDTLTGDPEATLGSFLCPKNLLGLRCRPFQCGQLVLERNDLLAQTGDQAAVVCRRLLHGRDDLLGFLAGQAGDFGFQG